MIMCKQNLVKFCPFILKIWSKNLILESIKGRNSVANLRKNNGRMKKIQLKMKALECSQDFSHYKSMGIFPDAQGQLTIQSLVRSGRISNSSKMLWMSSLPASMKKIQSKMKALEWTQHYTAIFQTRKGR